MSHGVSSASDRQARSLGSRYQMCRRPWLHGDGGEVGFELLGRAVSISGSHESLERVDSRWTWSCRFGSGRPGARCVWLVGEENEGLVAVSASTPRLPVAEFSAYFLNIPICFVAPFGAFDCSTEEWG